MENLRLNNKENILNNYGPTPTLPFDVEGTLVGKDGKNVKIEKTIDNKTVEFSLRLKKELVQSIGENVQIEKEDIVSSKVKEKEDPQETKETQDKDSKDTIKAEDVIKELGLEYTEENIRMVEFLLRAGLPVSKSTVDSYMKSKEYLGKIIEGLDSNSAAKLIDRGIDLEEGNLQKIAETLEEIKGEKSFSLKRFLGLERDLTYKEAEEISKEIYGQKMGKDVYDAIIALHKEKQPITKENIDKTIDILSKIHNLKDIGDEVYIKIIKDQEEFNINNLYKLNNSYNISHIEENKEAKNFEIFNTRKDISLDGLKEILISLDLDTTRENINILREFIINDMAMDREKYEDIILMKDSLKEFISLAGEEEIIRLEKEGINILEENISDLIKEIKKENPKELTNLNSKEIENIKENLETLGRITEKELLILIKNNEDLTLKNIKEIIDISNMENSLGLDNKLVGKTIHISSIFNSLGENLNPKLLSFTLEKHSNITLENLYLSSEELKFRETPVKPVENIEGTRIYEEYIRARNSLTTNIIKDSIKQNKILEKMPLGELNDFIKNKANKYKENERLMEEMKDIKGNQEKVIPFILKNQLPMTIKNIKEINSILKDFTNPNENNEELMGLFNNQERELGGDRNRKKEPQIKLEKINKKDYIFKIPIEIDDSHKEVSIIIPNMADGIDKNNMSFYLNLETENLGEIKLGLKMVDNNIEIKTEEGHKLNKYMNILEERLEKLGYNLFKKVGD